MVFCPGVDFWVRKIVNWVVFKYIPPTSVDLALHTAVLLAYNSVVHGVIAEFRPALEVLMGGSDPGIKDVYVHTTPIT